jgi:hypothetical protein
MAFYTGPLYHLEERSENVENHNKCVDHPGGLGRDSPRNEADPAVRTTGNWGHFWGIRRKSAIPPLRKSQGNQLKKGQFAGRLAASSGLGCPLLGIGTGTVWANDGS